MEWADIILAVIGSSVLTALVNNLYQRRKLKAEANKLDIDAETLLRNTTLEGAQQVIKIIESQRDWLANQLKEADMRVSELKKRIDEQDAVIEELLQERDKLRIENEHLRDEITELKAWKNGVEESGEIAIRREDQ